MKVITAQFFLGIRLLLVNPKHLLCVCRTPNQGAGGQGKSGQTIEMVEGSYGNADSHAAANPFGFDSFGNSLAAPAQHTSRPPRAQQPNRQSLVGPLPLHIKKGLNAADMLLQR